MTKFLKSVKNVLNFTPPTMFFPNFKMYFVSFTSD